MFLSLSNIILAYNPLKVDPGKDTSYCYNMNNNIIIQIGGKPTASDGTKPYKYSWELYSKTTKAKLSLLVDSTKNTLSNFELTPTINFMNDYYIFKITVTDSNHITVSDSCEIGISGIKNTTNVYVRQLISDSVTIGISSTVGGILPFTYHWIPETGLSNPYISNPKAKPNVDTWYTVEITDSIGCKNIDNGTRVSVVTGFDELNISNISFFNPIRNFGTMNFTSELMGSQLKIVSVGGIVQYQTKVEGESIPIGSLILLKGIYFYTITTTQGKVVSGSFVRE